MDASCGWSDATWVLMKESAIALGVEAEADLISPGDACAEVASKRTRLVGDWLFVGAVAVLLLIVSLS